MYLLIFEDGTSYQSEELKEGILEGISYGVVAVYTFNEHRFQEIDGDGEELSVQDTCQ